MASPLFRALFSRSVFYGCLVLVLMLGLSGCVNRAGTGAKAPANPNDQQAAYGVTVNVPPVWELAILMAPEKMSRQALEQKYRAGERILLLAAAGPPSSAGQESVFSVFLVNDNIFLPRSFAEKLQPHEFEALSRELLNNERKTAKENKLPINIMDLQIARETINGNFAISQKSTMASPQGVPLRYLRWDVYLADGAGITMMADFDSEQAGLEQQVQAMARSLRVQ